MAPVILTWLCVLLMLGVIFMMGVISLVKNPKNIALFGYRSKSTCANDETWKLTNQISGKILITDAIVGFIIALIVFFLQIFQFDRENTLIPLITLVLVSILPLVTIVPIVEYKLKANQQEELQ